MFGNTVEVLVKTGKRWKSVKQGNVETIKENFNQLKDSRFSEDVDLAQKNALIASIEEWLQTKSAEMVPNKTFGENDHLYVLSACFFQEML